MSGQQQLVPRRGILAAAIRVVQEPGQWIPVRQRHGAGLLGQLHGQPVPHRPADHEARGEIEDHGEVEPARCGPHVGAVPDPRPGWMRHHELVIEGVLGHGLPVIRLGGGSPRRHGLGSDPVDTHQPSDTMRADVASLLDQRVPDAGTAVDLTGLLVDHSNRREQGAGTRRLGTLRS